MTRSAIDELAAHDPDAAAAIAGLRDDVANYRALLDVSEDGFCIIEVLFDTHNEPADYRFLEINAAFVRQTGLVDAVGRTMRELAPDHEQHWFDIYGRIALTGIPERFEDGAAALGRWYEVSAVRIGEPSERRLALLFRDILPRRQAETALRRSEERFRAFVTASSDVVYRMSADWSQMHQLEGRAFLPDTTTPRGDWIDHYIYPDDRAAMRAAITHAIETKSVFELTHRVIRIDGKVGWTMSRAVPVLDEDGTIREWLGTASDVTAAHEAAAERDRVAAALRESEALRTIALTGGRMGTWRWDLASGLIWGDPQFMAFWGLPPSDDPLPLSRFTGRMSPDAAAEIEAIAEKGIVDGDDLEGAIEIVAGETAGQWVRWQGRSAAGDTSMLYGVTFAITEQKRAEAQLQESENRLQLLVEATTRCCFKSAGVSGTPWRSK